MEAYIRCNGIIEDIVPCNIRKLLYNVDFDITSLEASTENCF